MQVRIRISIILHQLKNWNTFKDNSIIKYDLQIGSLRLGR